MNKSELIDAVANSAVMTKAEAGRAVEALLAAVVGALKAGDQITLVGFGTFAVRERSARTGRDPRSGQKISIKASRNPVFKAGKAFKDALK